MRSDLSKRRRGFTLIEASLAVVIVGTGVVAAMALFTACTQQNAHASRLTTAAMLARNVEEVMVYLPIDDPIFGTATFGPEQGETLANFDDLDDFHGFDSASLGGPIDSLRRPIPELADYSQRVRVTPVQANNLAVEATPTSDARRVDVEVWYTRPSRPPEMVHTTSWYRMR